MVASYWIQMIMKLLMLKYVIIDFQSFWIKWNNHHLFLTMMILHYGTKDMVTLTWEHWTFLQSHDIVRDMHVIRAVLMIYVMFVNGKNAQKSFSLANVTWAKSKFEFVHTYLCGPMSTSISSCLLTILQEWHGCTFVSSPRHKQ